jgi:hypothetical protein
VAEVKSAINSLLKPNASAPSLAENKKKHHIHKHKKHHKNETK